jgi:hypothetical protein
MKKLKVLFAFIVLLGTVGLNAQAKQEQKAKKLSEEITKVLSLNKEESSAVYQIQLDRFKENFAIESEFANDPEGKKEKLKALGNKTYNKMRTILGQERQKKWKEYLENK